MTAYQRVPAWRLSAATLAIATFVALTVSYQIMLGMRDHGHELWRIASWQGSLWGFWAAAAPWVCRLCTFPDGRPSLQRSLALIGAGAALIAANLVAGALVMLALQPYVPVATYTFGSALDLQIKTHALTSLLACTMMFVAGRGAVVGQRARQLALREAQLEADVSRARLDALRLEIQPHFLFNTLNSIAALIRIRANDQALSMLLGLSELMRATIDRTPTHVTPLPLEIAFTKRYVELQQVRFGDRLEVRYAIDPACESTLVPSFLLQPIVENAFRHGIGAKAGPCRLELGATALPGGRLRLSVRDDGAGLPTGFSLERDAGTGLSNIRTRLQNLYGPPATMAVGAAPGGGTLVTVDLPASPPADLARATA
jgi:signal transduction histidine kinase